MGFWKVLGYAVGGTVVGVGAVAAAPFTGGGSLLGAATLATSLAGAGAAAAGAGAAGAAAGGIAGKIISETEKEKIDNARDEGKQEGLAYSEKKMKKMLNAIQNYRKKLDEDKEYFQFITGLFAIGMATANADNNITDEELTELEEFVEGIARSNLPAHVKNVIKNFKGKPPTFNEAMEYIRKHNIKVDIELFEDVIKLVANADGSFDEEEKALLEAFRREVA